MPASPRPHSTESKSRFLYLGTDVEFITALRRVLTEPDYRMVACSDWGSAVLFLESEIPYQLLLIDFEWRGKEGLKLARLAKSLSHRKRLPIILVATAELSSDIRALARKAGVKDYVIKTTDAGVVSERIKRMIE